MASTEPPSTAGCIAVAALGLLGLVGGAFIVAIGGFTHTPKWSKVSTFVGGPPAYAMAAIFFTLSVLACLSLLRSFAATLLQQAAAAAGYLATVAELVVSWR